MSHGNNARYPGFCASRTMGVSPMAHGRDARAAYPRAAGVSPMAHAHGRDARATYLRAAGILPMAHGRDARAASRRGFTLAELLVALAIFMILMAGVTMLFVSGLRTVRQAYQSMDIFEAVRGVLHVLEWDLTTAFTSRDAGYHYSFYGTPIGMTLVGLTGSEGGDELRMGRVTYAVYQDRNAPAPDAFEDRDGDTVYTFKLLRYVEPGATDLETFPIDWPDPRRFPDPPANDALAKLWWQLYWTLEPADGSTPRCSPTDDACWEEVFKAKKRELWIRMLAGDPDPFLPDLWRNEADAFAEFHSPNQKFPEDYIVLEGIQSLGSEQSGEKTFEQLVLQGLPFLPFAKPGAALGPYGYPFEDADASFFEYGYSSGAMIIYWNDTRNIDGVVEYSASEQEEGYAKDDLDFGGRSRRAFLVPNQGWPEDVFKGLTLIDQAGYRFNITGNAPIPLTNGHAFFIDGYYDELPVSGAWSIVSDLGSPLRPRIPELIMAHLRIRADSPFPGTASFDKTFDQEIDLPTGYARERVDE